MTEPNNLNRTKQLKQIPNPNQTITATMAPPTGPSDNSQRNAKPTRPNIVNTIVRTIPHDSPMAQRHIANSLAHGPSYGWKKSEIKAHGLQGSWLNTEAPIDLEAELRDITSPPTKAEKEKKVTAPKKKSEVNAEASTAAKTDLDKNGPPQKPQAPEASMGVGPWFG
jgi:hypothetical protein